MRMMKKLLGGVMACGLMLSLPAIAQDSTFTATLTGDQEATPNNSPATGDGIFRLISNGDSLDFQVTWSNLTAGFSGIHIHLGPPGVPGPIVVNLVPFVTDTAGGAGMAAGVVVFPDSLLGPLQDGLLYVNVHSDSFPPGEIRGQLLADDGEEEPDNAEFEPDEIGESYCISLVDDSARPALIILQGVTEAQIPVVVIALGCMVGGIPCDTTPPEPGEDTLAPNDCVPATFYQIVQDWSYEEGNYVLRLIGDGCVCVTLETVLPVEFGQLSAVASAGAVTLRWNTLSERNLDVFEVSRALGAGEASILGTVPATNSAVGNSYEFVDASAVSGQTYRYTLAVRELDGSRRVLATVDAAPLGASPMVTSYRLYEAYPNPFNPSTRITFDLLEAGPVTLTVFDLMGREVGTLVRGQFASGRHEVAFDGAGLPSGLYIYRLEVNGFTDQQKMLLLK